MTDPTPTPQAPSQGLTDAQLLELMPEQFRADLATASRLAAKDAGPDTKPGVFRVILNTGAVAYARAAIAAHEAARVLAPEEVETRFRAWIQQEHGLIPSQTATTYAAAFALHMLRGEVK